MTRHPGGLKGRNRIYFAPTGLGGLVVGRHFQGVALRFDITALWAMGERACLRARKKRSDVPVEFIALEQGSGSESAFMRDRFFYGVRGRTNVGFGLWQTGSTRKFAKCPPRG